MSQDNANIGMSVSAQVDKNAVSDIGALGFNNNYTVTCVGADGNVKWVENFENIFVTTGLNHVLDVVLRGTAQATDWYVGLKNAGAPLPGDTLASTGNAWAELTGYSESARPTLTVANPAASASLSTSSAASYSITSTLSVAGIFLADGGTKGSTADLLLAAGDFASAKSVENGDTLNVNITFNATSS